MCCDDLVGRVYIVASCPKPVASDIYKKRKNNNDNDNDSDINNDDIDDDGDDDDDDDDCKYRAYLANSSPSQH